jgi:hypothetical protein
MAGLVFERHPVDCGAACINGRFGQWYDIEGRPPYQHRGVDYDVSIGTPVFAPAAGTVVEFGNDGGFGIGVCLDHQGTPWYSLYAHLDRADVNIGDRVEAGQRLGLSGRTGFVTGPHLHWQVCRSRFFPPDIAESTDPLAFLGARPAPAMTEERFLREVLTGLDLEPTAVRLAMLAAWARYEAIPFERTWNPLASTRWQPPVRLDTGFNEGHGPGNWDRVPVRVYLTADDGIRATVDSLRGPDCAGIREALLREQALDAALDDLRSWSGRRGYAGELLSEWRAIAEPRDDRGQGAGGEATRIQRLALLQFAATAPASALARAHSLLTGHGLLNGPG